MFIGYDMLSQSCKNATIRYDGAMPYQYQREPSTPDEATRLANACRTHEE